MKISVSKVIRTIVWPRRQKIFFGLLLILVAKISGLVLPGAFKYLIDDVILAKDISMLFKVILAVLGAIMVQATASFLLTKILSIEAHRVIAELRVKVQKKVMDLPISFFERNKSGEIAKRVMDDIDGIKNLIGTGFALLVGGIITSIASLAILLYINVALTVYTVVPLILLGVTSLKAYKYLRPIFRKRKQVEASVLGRLTETLGGMRIIKGYNAEAHETEVFEEGAQSIFAYYKKSLTAQAVVMSAATLILGMASVVVMWLGSKMIIAEEMAMGEFISFILYLGFMVSPIIQMSNIGSLLTEAIAGLDRTEELMNMQSEGDNLDRHIELKTLQGEVVFENVSFAYSKEDNVLNNIDLTVTAGSSIALVGPSGAGKSTMASLLATFIVPTEGSIKIDGHDLNHVALQSYRKHIGMVLQDDFLFDGSIRENILFSQPIATNESLQKAVEAAYVTEFTDRFEDGLDTIIGERGVKLSGGQRQRISIARAILSDPKILILDEATSSLDVESEVMIQDSLSKLIAKRTTVIIAHRLSTIKNADQILLIEQGKIVESGTHEFLLQKKGKYFDMINLQSRI